MKQKQDYEEAQIKLTNTKSTEDNIPQPEHLAGSTTPVNINPPLSRPSPGYEDLDPTGYEQIHPAAQKRPSPKSKRDFDDYNDPADSLPEHFLRDRKAKLSGHGSSSSSSSPKKQKAFQLSTSTDEYTEVFDNLPPGEVGVVGLPKTRAMSESHSSRKRTSPKHGVVQNGLKESGVSRPAGGSLENVQGFGDRMDSTRQSKRDSAKEIVELDLSKRKFRMTSGKRDIKKSKDTIDGEISTEVESSKKFEVSAEVSNQSYAVVNLADKQKYRTESDDIKKEGSGAPRHYGNEVEALKA